MGNCCSKNKCNGREEKNFVDYNILCRVLEKKTNSSSQNNNNCCEDTNNCKNVKVVRQPNWRDDYDDCDCGCNNNYVENTCSCNYDYEETNCGCNNNHVYVDDNDDCNCSYSYDYLYVEENDDCDCDCDDNEYVKYDNRQNCNSRQRTNRSCKKDVEKESFEVYCKCYKIKEDNDDCGCNNNSIDMCCNKGHNHKRNKKSYREYINWCNCN